MRDIEHIHDPELLQQLVSFYKELSEKLFKELKTLREENIRLRGEGSISAIQQELYDLQARINALNAKLYGPSSERRTDDNSSSDGDSDKSKDSADSNDKKKKKQKGHGPTPQPLLPIIDVYHALDDADRICPHCGKTLRTMKDQHEECFEVDIIPAKLILKHHLREKAACDNGCIIETAQGPLKLIPGGQYSIPFTLDIATGRYLEHTPLERLRKRYLRMGLTVSVQTLFDQLYAAATYLVSTWTAVWRHQLTREQLFGDETPWPLFTPEGKKTWYLWSLSSPEATFYSFADSRSALVSRLLLLEFEGCLQCDGLASYSALPENGGKYSTREYVHYLHPTGYLVGTSKSLLSPMTPLPIVIGMCWSHVRRKFLPFEDSLPGPTHEILRLIRRLYGVEEEARQLAAQRAGPDASPEVLQYQVQEARALLRPQLSAQYVEDIAEFLKIQHALPQSGFEKAKNYVRNHWKALTVFLTEPSLELDNNASERSLRGPVVSRKNSYGSHSERGLLVTAVFYTLFESAKLSGVEPAAYVQACLEKAIKTPGATLLPWEFARSLEESSRLAA